MARLRQLQGFGRVLGSESGDYTLIARSLRDRLGLCGGRRGDDLEEADRGDRGPRGWRYILGARPRATKEVREVVLGDEAPFGEIEIERRRPKPMKLEVKEVVVGKDEEGSAPRYIVCRNPKQAARDAVRRAGSLEKLEGKLSAEGPKGLVANRGFSRYLKSARSAMAW